MNEKMKMGLTLIPIEQSIAGMMNVIETLPPEQSGGLYQWNGQALGY